MRTLPGVLRARYSGQGAVVSVSVQVRHRTGIREGAGLHRNAASHAAAMKPNLACGTRRGKLAAGGGRTLSPGELNAYGVTSTRLGSVLDEEYRVTVRVTDQEPVGMPQLSAGCNNHAR